MEEEERSVARRERKGGNGKEGLEEKVGEKRELQIVESHFGDGRYPAKSIQTRDIGFWIPGTSRPNRVRRRMERFGKEERKLEVRRSVGCIV